jgi:hypothetical protein
MKKLSKNLRYLDNISNTCNNTSISSKDLHDCYSQSFVNYKKLKNTFKNNNKSSLFGKQEILIEQLIEKDKIQKIYKYLILDKLCGSKNTNQKLNLIIFEKNLDSEIYFILKRKGILKNFRLNFISLIFNIIYENLLFIYCFLKIFLLPEIILINLKRNKIQKKSKFSFAFNLDHVGNSYDPGLTPNKREFGHINIENDFKLKCLKVIRYQHNSKNYYSLKKKLGKKKNYLILNDVYNYLNINSFLNKFYKKFSLERFNYLKLINVSNCKVITKCNIESNAWNIFYEYFFVKNFISLMTYAELVEQYFQNRFSDKTFFIYLSSNDFYSNLRLKNNDTPDNLQYSYLNYDCLICDEFSKNFFIHEKNSFKKFLNFGNLNFNFLKSLKYKNYNYKNKKILIFYDNSYGFNGVCTTKQYIEYLKFILTFMSKNNQIYFFLKIKNNNINQNNETKSIKRIIENIQLLKNHVKNLKFENNYRLSKYSSINISLPFSSTINENILENKKILIMDVSRYYINQKKHLYNKLKIVFKNYKKLEKEIINCYFQEPIKDRSGPYSKIINREIGNYNDKSFYKQFVKTIKSSK